MIGWKPVRCCQSKLKASLVKVFLFHGSALHFSPPLPYLPWPFSSVSSTKISIFLPTSLSYFVCHSPPPLPPLFFIPQILTSFFLVFLPYFPSSSFLLSLLLKFLPSPPPHSSFVFHTLPPPSPYLIYKFPLLTSLRSSFLLKFTLAYLTSLAWQFPSLILSYYIPLSSPHLPFLSLTLPNTLQLFIFLPFHAPFFALYFILLSTLSSPSTSFAFPLLVLTFPTPHKPYLCPYSHYPSLPSTPFIWYPQFSSVFRYLIFPHTLS